jgi:SOS response regulatory protein OraA/RecX
VRTAARVKGRGRIRISRELASRGLDREAVNDAMRELDPADEASAIKRILIRKRWPAKPSLAERQKMFRHLLGRGFTSDAISRALGRDSEEE